MQFRAVERADLAQILALRNDPSTWVNLTDPRMVSHADQEAWFQKIGLSTGRWYFVAHNSDHPFVGLVRMDEHDPINRSIRVGADVAKHLRGQGLGTQIYKRIKAYCFQSLNIHRIWLCVLDINSVGIRLYERSGFKLEGRYRQAIWREGRWVDYLIMSTLSSEQVDG